MKRIEGHLDGVSNGYVGGWAVDRYNQFEPLEVTIIVNGEVMGTTTADIYRKDLEAGGIGLGKYGFKLKLADHVVEQERLVIDAIIESLNVKLHGSDCSYVKNNNNQYERIKNEHA
jgi:hypothetical protein